MRPEEQVRALLQSALVGCVGRRDFPLFAPKLEQETDEEGNYLPYFTVVTFSGHRLRVTVEVEE